MIEEIVIDCMECGTSFRANDVIIDDVKFCLCCGSEQIESELIEVSLPKELFEPTEDE